MPARSSGAIPTRGESFETPVTGGQCKLQWKPDWAMRWDALGVDYEMAGKDLIDSVKLSGEICAALGGTPPEGFNYELFLDEKGQKISKSKGNGLTIDEWLAYARPESLALFMYQKPREAKRLYFDVIPRTVDDYLTFLAPIRARTGRSGSAIRSGTSMPAIRRRPKLVGEATGPRSDLLRLLLNLAPSRTAEEHGGAVGLPPPLCAATSRRRRIRGSTGWSAMRSAISTIS